LLRLRFRHVYNVYRLNRLQQLLRRNVSSEHWYGIVHGVRCRQIISSNSRYERLRVMRDWQIHNRYRLVELLKLCCW